MSTMNRRRPKPTPRSRHTTPTALLACALLFLAGCTPNGLFQRRAEPVDLVERADPGAAQLDVATLVEYLDIMQALIEGDPVQQVDAFLEVASAAAATPNTTNRLKLALAIAIPGHPSSDPVEAAQRLRELLSSGSALTAEERTLVAIHLKEVEQRLVLDREAERQRAAALEAQALRTNNDSARLEALMAENSRLARELQEAQQKLDDITRIERSIRERENGADSQ